MAQSMNLRREIIVRYAGIALLVSVPTVVAWQFGRLIHPRKETDTSSARTADAVAQRLMRTGNARPDRTFSPMTSPATPLQLGLEVALKSIRGESDSARQDERIERLANEIAMADLPAAASFLLEEAGSELARDLGVRLIRRWAEADPRLAANWVSRMSPGVARQEAIEGMAIVWANQSLSDAVEWIRQLPEEGERQGGMLIAAYEAARTEPTAALQLAIELPANPTRDELMVHAASQWAARDPQATADWAKQIPDAELRERTFSAIALAWAESDPAAAATLAVKLIPLGRHQDDAVVGIVQRWVQKQPEQAAAWVARFPEGSLRESALENLVKLWADRDPEQTGSWLKGAALNSSHDTTVGAFANQISPSFPHVAAFWVEQIGDEAIRAREMEAVGEAWMGSDANAARVWIAQTPLSEAVKMRLFALQRE